MTPYGIKEPMSALISKKASFLTNEVQDAKSSASYVKGLLIEEEEELVVSDSVKSTAVDSLVRNTSAGTNVTNMSVNALD